MDNDKAGADWRTSTYSNGQGNCVEIARAGDVLVRDTKNRAGDTLNFPGAAWMAFTEALRTRVSEFRDGLGIPG